ncbi:unnamed protein product [Pocillopora meandrina]|uniref:Mutator-like transposase domain-containing protein n=1 Tax=Pocillopora meandrina TaxID=46732 RepID=A0AAU9XIP6_9CNID|nr:unnamed protein product [Pocillopora meandrina]
MPRESLTRKRKTAVLQNNVAVGKKARRSESQDAEEQLQSQPGRPANYRSKTVRKEQCKAMREQRWSDKVRNEISLGNTADNVPEGPTLRSSLPYTKAVNMDQCYVVNLEMLTTALSECVNCKQGPLDLRNSFNVRPEGVCPVLKVKCTQCEFINIVRPAEHHRTGKKRPSHLRR